MSGSEQRRGPIAANAALQDLPAGRSAASISTRDENLASKVRVPI